MLIKRKIVKSYKAYEKEAGKPPKTVEMLKYSGFKNEEEAREWISGFEKRFERVHQELEDMRKEFFGKFAMLPKLFELPSLKMLEKEERTALPEKPAEKKKKQFKIKVK
ncbi:MAG: hypothetical protein QME47_03295 [Candidatus Thermoplasmatota archaeon]|nr:hypothetical protein [Candidatus Thermoplasmatota archaeon]